MMRRKIFLTAILFFAILIGKGQNLNIIVPTYQDTCNKIIEVPIKVTNFNNLLALQFSVGWDNAKLNFVGIENYGPASMNLSTGNFGLTNASATGLISFSWNDGSLAGITLADSSTIFVLKFLITGSDGTIGNISIQNNPTNLEAIKSNFQNELITVISGGVNITCPPANFLHLIAPPINEACSKIIEIPIRAINFKELISAQFTLKWDPTLLGFIGISNYGEPSLSINSNAFGTTNSQNGKLSFRWNDASLQGKTIADTAVLFKLKFFTSGYTASQSQLSFTNDLATVEAVNQNMVSIPVNIFSSNVNITCANEQGLSIIAPTVTDSCGKNILVPIRAARFSNLLSTQFSIGWDNTKLSFQGIENFGNAALNLGNSNFGTTQTSNGKLIFSWNDPSALGISINDTATLFVLKFNIIGADSEISPINILNSPTAIEAINVGLSNTPVLVSNGRVNIVCPSPEPLNIVINNYTDTCNQAIDIPIKVSNFKDLLSLQFSLSWDPAKLNFSSISNYGDGAMQLTSNNFGFASVNSGQLSFSWNDASLEGVNLSDSTILFKLRFTLVGNEGDAPIVNIIGTSIPIEAVNKNLVVLPTVIKPGIVTIRCPQPNELAIVIPSSTENCETDVEIPISVVQFRNLLSLQFSIGWDKEKLNFLSVSNYGPSSLQLAAGNFGTNNVNNGSMSFSWNDGNLAGLNLADSTVLFKLKFAVIGIHGTSTLVKILNTPAQTEAINTSLSSVPTNVVDGNIAIECTNCISTLEGGASNISFCTSSTYTLTASPTTASSYEWYRNNVKIATTTTNTLSINNVGSYVVKVLYSSGCLSTSNTVVANNFIPSTITIASSPSNDMVCIGSSATLTASGASSYSWTGGIINGNLFTPTQTGTYTVTGKDSNGCTSISSKTITVLSLPIVSISSSTSSATICLGQSITLTGTGANNYSWTGGIVNSTSFTPIQSGTYTVTGTDINGCSNTASQLVTIKTLPVPSITSNPQIPTICLGENIILTATGGVSYTWTGGVINGSYFAPTQSGSYTVTVIGANGCSTTSSIYVTVNNLPTSNISVTPNTQTSTVCLGQSISLTANGGVNYSWTGGITNGVSFIPSQTSSYTVTVVDANGCSSIATKTIVVNALPTIGTVSSPVSASVCIGGNVSLTGTGGVSYSWSGGVIDGQIFTPTQSGTYTVTGTDANGCVNTAIKTITVNSLPTITATINPSNGVVCAGDNVTLTGSGGVSYIWQGGVVNSVPFNAIQSGTYTVTGTDVNGCVGTATKTIVVNALPTIGTVSNPVSASVCIGGNVSLTGTGGVSYSWTGGVIDGQIFTPTQSGTYTVTGTDVNGCSSTATKTIVVNALPTIGTVSNPVSASVCIGGNVSLTGTGGVSYSWSGGVIDGQIFTPTQSGTYTVTGTDVNGCVGTATKTIVVNALPTIGTVSNPVSASVCIGGNVSLTGTGGVSYSWTGGVIDGQIFTPTQSGTYTVTGTDVNGCSSTATKTIVVNALPTIGTVSNPVSASVCIGGNVSLTGTGGVSYSWSGGVIDGQIFTPTQSGTYTVTGTDANGCVNTAIKTITVNSLPIITATINPSNGVVCAGDNVTLTGSGGVSYIWQGGVVNSVPFNATQSGTYTVTGTDVNGCVGTATKTIVVNALPTIGTVSNPVSASVCIGGNVSLSGTGGVSYSWTGGVIDGQLFTPTQTTSYIVTGTDANGCTNSSTQTITVINSPAPNIIITSNLNSNSICIGSTISLSASGGVSYIWQGGVLDGQLFTPTQTTTYTVTGTDANGCSSIATKTIVVNALPTIGTVSSPVSASVCIGGNVSLTGTGGVSYSWSGGVIDGQIFTPTQSGTYTVTGTDANGCVNTAIKTITVNSLPTITATINPSNGVVCAGDNVTLTGSGGVSYIWQGGVVNSVPFNAIQSGTYTVTGTDVNGCVGTATKTIVVNALPTIGTVSNPVSASVCIGGNVSLTGTGGVSYSWTGGVIDGQIFTPTQSGTYTVTGTDANGCSNTAIKTIVVNALPTIGTVSIPVSASVCIGGNVSLTGTGGVSYSWSGGVLDGQVFTPTQSGTYTVTGTDVNGCVGTATKTIVVNALPTIGTVSNPVSASVCIGGNVSLTGTGGVSYSWTGGVIDGQIFTPTQSGTYTVTGTDVNGCSSTATKTIVVNALPTIGTVSNPVSASVCIGGNVSLTGTGGVSYSWSGGVIDGQIFTPTQSGTYTVTGTDANGCVNTAIKTITVNSLPIITATINPSNGVVCAGDNVTLTGSGGVSYIWQGGVVNSVPFNATQSGTYTVTGTDVNGCVGTATKTIVVNALPTIGTVSNPVSASVCIGGNVSLSGTGGVSYSWTGGVIDGQLFTPTQTTSYIVTGTDANGCTNSSTQTITVINSPAPNIIITSNLNSNSICIGSTISLSASGGVSYIWQGGVLDGQLFTPTQTTTYTVTGTDANGCSSIATKTIVVNALPTIGTVSSPVSASVCIGGNVSLTGTGGVSYSWTGGVIDGQIFTPTQSGTYTVTGTDANGCSNTAIKTIVVNALPTIGTVSIPVSASVCIGGNVSLTGTGGVSYSWSGGVLDGQVFTPTQSGTYTVTGTDANGCVNTAIKTITVNSLPIITATINPSNGVVCAGDNVTLTGSGGVSYIWQGGVVNSVPFNATQSGTYTVTGTDANGCSKTASIGIVVHQLPQISISSNPAPANINLGSSIQLIASGAQTFEWSGGVTNGVTFKPTMTTRYIVKGTNSFGCSDTTSILVNVNLVSIKFVMPEITDSCQKIIEIPIKVLSFSDIISAQYSVDWDTTNLQFLSISNYGSSILRISSSNFGLKNTVNGSFSFSWSDPTLSGISLADSSLFYTMRFLIKGSDRINTQVRISSLPTPIEIIDKNMQTINISKVDGLVNIKCIDCIVSLQNGKTLDSICAGNAYLLSANTSNGIQYTWYKNGLLFNKSKADTLSINSSGEYYVKSLDSKGCLATSNRLILNHLLPPNITITANPSNAKICAGDAVSLTAQGATNYRWTDGILNAQFFTPSQSGTYTVTGTGINGCLASASANVIVNASPVVSITGDKYLCPGSSLILKANTNGITNQWYFNGIAISGGDSPNIAANKEGVYSLVSTNSDGCSNKYLVADTIQSPIIPNLDFNINNSCVENVIKFTNLSSSNNSLPINWKWSFGDNSAESTLINPEYKYQKSGYYVVSLNAEYAFCKTLNNSVSKKINIQEPTKGENYAIVFVEANRSVNLNARSIGIDYKWIPGIGISDSTIANPIFNYSFDQLYKIQIIESSGCVVVDTLLVSIKKNLDEVIFVPTAFSPNGDGQNDKLIPFFINMKKMVSFKVYGRWGQLVFQTQNQGEGWDGYINGVKQPLDTYFWICEIVDINDRIINKMGQTLLIR